jgi:dihydroorotase
VLFWALALMLNAVNEGKISLGKVIELYSETPAKIFRIKNKGKIEVGYDADFSIIDMDKKWVIKEEDTISKCAWTPYNNWEIKGSIEATYVRGSKVYEDNKFYENNGKEVELIG